MMRYQQYQARLKSWAGVSPFSDAATARSPYSYLHGGDSFDAIASFFKRIGTLIQMLVGFFC
jgi:hypothetical protein